MNPMDYYPIRQAPTGFPPLPAGLGYRIDIEKDELVVTILDLNGPPLNSIVRASVPFGDVKKAFVDRQVLELARGAAEALEDRLAVQPLRGLYSTTPRP